MKHKNIAVFIPHYGCTHKCSFCDQRTIAGQKSPPSPNEVRNLISTAYKDITEKSQTEIAFFGGSFTAIPRKSMIEYLIVANEFIGENGFDGIRISTRPDAIDEEILSLLKRYNVTSIELGAQSMDDDVLLCNNRGHDVATVKKASAMIKERGFSLGLQMMVGLYKSNLALEIKTANEIILCKPDTVRIYPTVVLSGTRLAELYESGEYTLPSLEDAAKLCGRLILMFEQEDIKVIKVGLHASNEVETEMVAGIYHPAFKELCESEIFLENATKTMKQAGLKNAVLFVSPQNLSKMLGQKKRNIKKLADMGYNVKILSDPTMSKADKYEITIKEV